MSNPGSYLTYEVRVLFGDFPAYVGMCRSKDYARILQSIDVLVEKNPGRTAADFGVRHLCRFTHREDAIRCKQDHIAKLIAAGQTVLNHPNYNGGEQKHK